MATVFREPLVGQSFARRLGSVDLIPNLLLTTLAVVAAAPFHQTQWPAPQKARFVEVTDVPQNILIHGIPAGPAPFRQTDWPATFKSRVVPNEPGPNLLVRQPVAATPFSQGDWFSPFKAKSVVTDIPPNLALTNAPVFFPAWNDPGTQNYKRVVLRVDLPSNLLLLQQPVTAPFGLDDWTPVPKYRSAQQAEVVPNILVRGIPASIAPFGQDDWFAPHKWRYAEPPNDWLNLPITTLQPATGVLTGVSGTGSLGNLTVNLSLALTGVTGTGGVGNLIPFTGTLIPLTGVSGFGSVGTLALSQGLIPNVQGIPLAVAALLLENAVFQVGALTYANSTTIPLGSVISQSPVADTLAFEDTKVDLLISSGFVSPVNNPTRPIHLPNLPNTILPPTNALVDSRGVMATNWWRYFLNVGNQAMGTNETSPATVAVSASPFVFTTPAQGTLLVSGGPVTLIEYSKDGITWYPTGAVGGPIQLVPNDQVRITYSNAPNLTFFPR